MENWFFPVDSWKRSCLFCFILISFKSLFNIINLSSKAATFTLYSDFSCLSFIKRISNPKDFFTSLILIDFASHWDIVWIIFLLFVEFESIKDCNVFNMSVYWSTSVEYSFNQYAISVMTVYQHQWINGVYVSYCEEFLLDSLFSSEESEELADGNFKRFDALPCYSINRVAITNCWMVKGVLRFLDMRNNKVNEPKMEVYWYSISSSMSSMRQTVRMRFWVTNKCRT